MNSEITILVHGFNKDHSDMLFIQKNLLLNGYNTFTANLPTTFSSLYKCQTILFLQIEKLIKTHETVHYVAHSMGGLIVRYLINSIDQKNIGKCVFIATPHEGSKLAVLANKIPFYSYFFKPIKSLLPRAGYKPFPNTKNFKVGIIAGNRNKGFLGRMLLTENSDGRVEVFSVKSSDSDEFIVLPYSHADIHHEIETFNSLLTFLKIGSFKKSRLSKTIYLQT
jgi:pimeloyl-ACP methyl ester carboxylesterase